MKNKHLLPILAVCLLAFAGLSAFKSTSYTAAEKMTMVASTETLEDGTVKTTYLDGGVRNQFPDGSEDYLAPSSIYYEKTWALDTITNANNDTLTATGAMGTMYSDFEYFYSIIRTNISGTTALALKVEQTNYTTGNTFWVTLASGAATTATQEALIGDCSAVRLRFIVDGSGTQSSSYRLRLVLKKKE